MMMINNQTPNSPYYSEKRILPSLVSTFDAPLRTVSPVSSCPPTEVQTRMRKQNDAPSEPLSPSKKRRCKKVDFGPDMTLAYIESSLDFTELEKDDRWYRTTEIASFKESARILCRDNKSSNDGTLLDDIEKDSIRGLDVYSPSRQRFSKRFTQHVLEAYYVRCVGNDQHVALLAEKWSKKSLIRATEMAHKDFLVAYFPEELEYESPPEDTVTLSSTLLPKDSYHIRVGAR